MSWFVEIIPFTGDKTDPGERDALRIERGANINLNHNKYYTAVSEEPPLKPESTA